MKTEWVHVYSILSLRTPNVLDAVLTSTFWVDAWNSLLLVGSQINPEKSLHLIFICRMVCFCSVSVGMVLVTLTLAGSRELWWHVCLYVFLSVYEHILNTKCLNFAKLLCMLVLFWWQHKCYVFPVLWMMSCSCHNVPISPQVPVTGMQLMWDSKRGVVMNFHRIRQMVPRCLT